MKFNSTKRKKLNAGKAFSVSYILLVYLILIVGS